MAHANNFNIEYQYQKYLKIVKITEAEMGNVQRKEMRQAFYGAWGMLLSLLNDIAELTEEEGSVILSSMHSQVIRYFKSISINLS